MMESICYIKYPSLIPGWCRRSVRDGSLIGTGIRLKSVLSDYIEHDGASIDQKPCFVVLTGHGWCQVFNLFFCLLLLPSGLNGSSDNDCEIHPSTPGTRICKRYGVGYAEPLYS